MNSGVSTRIDSSPSRTKSLTFLPTVNRWQTVTVFLSNSPLRMRTTRNRKNASVSSPGPFDFAGVESMKVATTIALAAATVCSFDLVPRMRVGGSISKLSIWGSTSTTSNSAKAFLSCRCNLLPTFSVSARAFSSCRRSLSSAISLSSISALASVFLSCRCGTTSTIRRESSCRTCQSPTPTITATAVARQAIATRVEVRSRPRPRFAVSSRAAAIHISR